MREKAGESRLVNRRGFPYVPRLSRDLVIKTCLKAFREKDACLDECELAIDYSTVICLWFVGRPWLLLVKSSTRSSSLSCAVLQTMSKMLCHRCLCSNSCSLINGAFIIHDGTFIMVHSTISAVHSFFDFRLIWFHWQYLHAVVNKNVAIVTLQKHEAIKTKDTKHAYTRTHTHTHIKFKWP